MEEKQSREGLQGLPETQIKVVKPRNPATRVYVCVSKHHQVTSLGGNFAMQ